MEELVLILDFGAQYSQLIARRVREANVCSRIINGQTSINEIEKLNPRGLILSGGPSSCYAQGAPQCDPEVFRSGIPVLGICYGMQLMAKHLRGVVVASDNREYGRTMVDIAKPGLLFKGIDSPMECWMSHGDLVVKPPMGFVVMASTQHTPVAAMGDVKRRLYGVQFHPEVVHTPEGDKVIRNFLYEICGLNGTWTPASFVEEGLNSIRNQVGNGKAICALSGGVDSSVAALLTHKAIGPNLVCVFVDHGLLRKGEAEQVVKTFKEKFNMNLIHVDARQRFLTRLSGVVDPETKRKIIGEEFIRVFEEQARAVGEVEFLVQGTLYPDVIESGTGNASVIKSHHNVGGLPSEMNLKLIEPLRFLFKDEVRKVAREIGLPEEITWRHPFPGPGLAVRVIGEVTQERLDILREADAIVMEELKQSGWDRKVWQGFAILPAMKSVGVMGDKRTYSYTVAVRAVTSEDGMTADWAKIPLEVLERISNRIVNEVPNVNRVVYDITSKPPATIEWE